MQPWMERPVQGSLAGEQPSKKAGFWEKLGQNVWPWEKMPEAPIPGQVRTGWQPFAQPGWYTPATERTTAIMGTEQYAQAEARRKAQMQNLPDWMLPETPTIPGRLHSTTPTTEPNLPQPDEGGAETPTQPTFFTDEQGIRWIHDEYTGTWSQVNVPTPPRTDTGLTPEQQLGEYEAQRTARIQEIERQMEMQRQIQEASAAQQMAQMYAADPYKYWAQLGAGTPEAVARLTGYQGLSAKELGALSPHERAKYIGELEERYPGQVAPGEEMQHTPLSTPSQQWWGNLLPSEQQQIMGGVNWLGIDPMDWYSMQQRMIPGLGARQLEPAWAR